MVALGTLLAQAQRDKGEDAFLERLRQSPSDRRSLWDRFYLGVIRQEPREVYEAARELARTAGHDPSADYAYIYTLGLRDNPPGSLGHRLAEDEDLDNDKTPPLPPDEVDLTKGAFISVVTTNPSWLFPTLIDGVLTELRRAGRAGDLDPFYRALVASANNLGSITVAGWLAADRGDFDALWTLFEAFNRIPFGTRASALLQGPSITTPQGLASSPTYFMAKAMRVKANAKQHAEILRLLDRYMDFVRSPEQTALRVQTARAAPPLTRFGGALTYPGFTVKNPRTRRLIDYPTPGNDFDHGAVLLLWNAFTLFERDDLRSDLLAHARKRTEAPANDPAAIHHARLVLSALLWLANERDESVRVLEQAIALVPGDANLKLTLAELRAQRRESDEALAVLDSVEAVDQDVTRRRELLALQLAVQTGRIDRARQAAERLFGLRLDSALQIQLAAQMNQLGMNELAEAVLGRARRRAGNNTDALVGLMAQYERQGKADVAVQIAHQILRRSQDPAATGLARADAEAYRRQAIQILARSGKLGEIIERLEAQLRQSPQSLQLHQSLAVYYQAAGERDKLRANTEAMLKLRPDDARLRIALANQIAQAGDTAAALQHYRTILKTDPGLFSANAMEIETAFRRQNKIKELAALIEQTEMKASFYSWFWPLAESLTQDRQTIEEGMRLFHRLWESDPILRPALLERFAPNEEFWKRPEAYQYAKAALIPASGSTRVEAWSGIDTRPGARQDTGRKIHTVATRLLEAAARQDKIDELAAAVEQAVARQPQWSAGKALLVWLRVRQGRADLGRRILDDLLNSLSRSLELFDYYALVVVGQELKDDPGGEPLAVAVYERMLKSARNPWGYTAASFPSSPLHHLARLYQRAGRIADARDLLLRAAAFYRSMNTLMRGSISPVLASRKLAHQNGCASFLQEIGDPVDATRVYNEVLGSAEDIQLARSDPEADVRAVLREAREGMKRAMNGLNPDSLAASLRALASPAPAGEIHTSGPAALDLVLMVYPRAVDEAAVISLYSRALELAAPNPRVMAELRSAVDTFAKDHPDDVGARAASALVDCAGGDPQAVAEAAGRLERLIMESPLDALSEGTRPNARQRAEAAPRMALWLVAHDCWKHESTRAAGDRLAALALEAARRQLDNTWALAMLREWGQQAEDRGDRALAETRWGAMIDLVLSSLAAPRAVAPADRPRLPVGRPAPRAAAGDGIPVATPEQFEQAAEIARLAANHGLGELSLRAVRGVLLGGPPLVAFNPSPESRPLRRAAAAAMTSPTETSHDQIVVMRLAELETLWRRGGASSSSVYETLRDVVLPAARPAEVFLYAAPLARVDKAPASVRRIPPRPQNVGALLAHWAVAAGRSDELRKRIAERQARPAGELPALVLLSHLAQAEETPDAVVTTLDAISRKLDKESLHTSAEVACHAALPAVEASNTSTARAAVAVVERAVRILAAGTDEEPVDTLMIALAQLDFERGGVTEGRKRIDQALALAERATSRSAGDDPLYRRKRAYAAAASEYLRAGLPADALDLLAQLADTPRARGGDPSPGGTLVDLAGRVADWPANERYERLKAWSLATPGRRSVRLVAGFPPESMPFEVYRGVADTASLLIAAARDAGKLDGLGTELEALDSQGVENARVLRILVAAARGQDDTAAPLAQALAADLRRPGPRGTAVNSLLATSGGPMPPAWPDILVARACLADPALRAVGEAMASDLIAHAEQVQALEFKGLLVRALASAREHTP